MPAQSPARFPAFVLLLLAFTVPALGQPTFTKEFQPDSIGPGSHSRLVFTISNGSGVLVTDLAFSDTLPAGVSFATPPSASTDCTGGTLTVIGSTLTLSGGAAPAFGTCTVVVDVISSTLGTHTNTSSDLTSNAGNSGPATDDLDVSSGQPGFSKGFSPTTIGLGGRSTLTFTLDNSANGGIATGASFMDFLPAGLVVADPANASTDCLGATFTATTGSTMVSMIGGALLSNSTCTAIVDVQGAGVGTHVNRSGDMTSSPGGPSQANGFAVDTLNVVETGDIVATKAFLDDPVNPGGTVELEFTLQNRNRFDSATGITFTDDLDATLSGLVAIGLPLSNVCGGGSTLSGTSTLTLTGGNLPAEGSCTFSVTLSVPAGVTAGGYPNTTSTIDATIGGSPATGDPATETLFVNDAPSITKTFLTDPVGAGDSVQLEFTITNSSSTSMATDIAFLDNISAFLSGVVYTSGFQTNICGAGSGLSAVDILGETHLNFFGGNLGPSASCTFTADLLVPANVPGGVYTNTSGPISATVDGTTQTGNTATDTLTVVGAPRLSKAFTDDPVAPGGTVTLEFTLELDPFSPTDATDISFTDDLNSTLTGLAATGLPLVDPCGTGSSLSGTTSLTFSGGTLAPGATCTFSVSLDVPAGALPGTYDNTTSSVTATVSGTAVVGTGATDTLTVAGLEFTKAFIDDPLLPGATGTLRFTIDNTSTIDVSGMFFTDSLTSALSGLSSTGALPTNPCGAGSSIAGTTTLIFVGGNLTAGTSCTFDVMVQVPAAAANGLYLNTTSNLVVGTPAFSIPPAADGLEVDDQILDVTKSFTNDPVPAGGTAFMEISITNTSLTETVTGISLTDDLDAMLSGAAAVGLPQSNVCGAGSTISGAGFLTLTGAGLTPGAGCTITVAVQVPAAAPDGSYPNTTSVPSGTASTGAVSGNAASDNLAVRSLVFSKAFLSAPSPGQTVDLQFEIENPGVSPAGSLSFGDDLSAVLTGLAVTGVLPTDPCGPGSSLTGTTNLSFTSGSLGAGQTCVFSVTLLVPLTAPAGMFANTTSDLFSSGLPVAAPATDTLDITAPGTVDATLTKSFQSSPVLRGQSVVVDYTITNSSAFLLTSVGFTDDFNAALTGLAATGLPVSNVCGSGSTLSGTGTLTLAGGTLAPGASCMFSVTLAVPTTAPAGTVTSTTSTLDFVTAGTPYSNAAATDSFDVALLGFTKAFQTNPNLPGAAVDLIYTITNPDPVNAISALTFTDDFDSVLTGLSVTTAPAAGFCGAGSTASGAGVLTVASVTVPADDSCVFTVTVQVPIDAVAGTYTSTTSDLTSAAVQLGLPAADDLEVIAPATVDATLTKSFQSSPVLRGQTVIVDYTITNASAFPLGSIGFTDDFDGALTGLVATGLPQNNVCGTGSILSGTGLLDLTGGSLAPGGMCAFSVTLAVPDTAPAGSVTSTTSTLDFVVAGASYSNAAATDSFDVALLGFAKAFQTNPVMPGDVVDLTFTITNPDPVHDITTLTFMDDLDAALSGLTATTVPADGFCGAGSSVTSGGLLDVTDVTVLADDTCVFTVTVQVPIAAAAGTYTNTTTDLTAAAVQLGLPATDDLTVDAPASVDVTITKAFQSTPVLPGGDVVLSYTIDNNSDLPVDTLAFTDDLDGALSGLAATGLPASDVCGLGSTLSGTGTVALAAGSLAPMSSCTFDITLNVPVTAANGTVSSTTGTLTFMAAGTPFNDGTATDTFDVAFLSFTKAFDANPVKSGDVVGLTFMIDNPDPVNAATGITFTDDLDAVIPGLAATGTPLADVCGLGSSLNGTSVINLAAGMLDPGGSCTFTVDVVIPQASNGTFVNITSPLSADVGGNAVTGDPADAATADLELANEVLEIPTVNHWGLLALIALLGGLAVRRIRLG